MGTPKTATLLASASSMAPPRAERTGCAALDEAIRDFYFVLAQELSGKKDEYEDGLTGKTWEDNLSWATLLKRPDGARNKCQDFSNRFTGFLQSRGFDAWATDNVRWREVSVTGQVKRERSNPEHFGYSDRTIPGGGFHAATEVEIAPNRRFLIDWTAAQYGYTDFFPLVQPISSPDTFLDQV